MQQTLSAYFLSSDAVDYFPLDTTLALNFDSFRLRDSLDDPRAEQLRVGET